MGRFNVELTVVNNRDCQMAAGGTLAPERVRQMRVMGVVDSGAAHLVLPESVAAQLGLPAGGDATVRYADHRTARRRVVEEVRVELLGRHGTFRAVVEPDRDTALIGAIVLEDLDFLVDCTQGQLRPRDPDRIVAEIE